MKSLHSAAIAVAFLVSISTTTYAEIETDHGHGGGGGLPASQAPECLDSRSQLELPVDNAQVLQWKESSKNQYRNRGHVLGKLVNIRPDQTGHHHLDVQIGTSTSDTIEIIYNEDFGAFPSEMHVGSEIEACGDYVTAWSNTQGGSPDGALLHWVHISDEPQRHPSGFVIIDGDVVGQQLSGNR